MIDRGKRCKTMNEAKPVKHINKNQQTFLKKSPVQEGVASSYKRQGHAYE